MYCKIFSSVLQGIDGHIVSVEVDVAEGFPRVSLVGLPDSTVKESVERVRSAIKNSGYSFPYKRITVNLAPADIRKVGAVYDLPIAIGILVSNQLFYSNEVADIMFIGELSLNGELRKINGILPMIDAAKQNGFRKCIVPYENAKEAAVITDIAIIGCRDLNEVVLYLEEEIQVEETKINIEDFFEGDDQGRYNCDFSDISGQETVRRALEIAVAGMHNVLLIGPPGAGKTMMAKRIPTILPDLSFNESIEITKIYSVSGLLKKGEPIKVIRPFRSPHHTVSATALTGGGRIPKPGEISLSHHGILFLDELPEFNKNVIEVLRQPLEDGDVTISRVNASITYPANFMLICSMNPCPCGYYPDFEKCTCTPPQIKQYLNRVSGPLLDRLDVQVEVGKVDYQELSNTSNNESSVHIKNRVQQAHNIQKERYKKENILFNSSLSNKMIERYCVVEEEGVELLKDAFTQLQLSARAYHRILKVGRTIADLEGEEMIRATHIAEAIQYRTLDRKYWGR